MAFTLLVGRQAAAVFAFVVAAGGPAAVLLSLDVDVGMFGP